MTNDSARTRSRRRIGRTEPADRQRLLRKAGALAALVLLSLPATARGQDTAHLADLMRAGHYGEAYDAIVHAGHEKDPAALESAARTLLALSIQSEDSFQRWAGLRAARFLDDAELAGAARKYVRDGGRYEQALALEILARSDPKGSRADFIAALDSPYRTVRIRALRALASLDEDRPVDRVATVLTEDPDPDVRALAARALRVWNATQAIPSLRKALDDEADTVQQEAVKTLVALGDDGIADEIRHRLSETPPDQRASVMRLAALVPDPDLIPDLGPGLADPDPDVRAVAAGAILSILAHVPDEK